MQMLFHFIKRQLLCQIFFLCFFHVSWAQNVTILPNGINPAPVGSIPRLSYEAILALPSPQLGDLAIDLTFRVMRMYNGGEWAILKTSMSQDLTDYTAMSLGGLLPSDVATDNSGNIYATGRFEGTVTIGELSLTSAGGTDIFVAKFNRFGSVQWLRRGGGSNFVDEEGKSIAVDGSGNVYVTGYFNIMANFNTPSVTGSNELISAGDIDIFVAKYNTSGAIQWLRRGGGTGTDEGNGIGVDGNGNVYVVGFFSGTANFNNPSASGSFELTSAGDWDVFVVKFSSLGTRQWVRRGGGTGFDEGKDITVDSNGDFYITGFFVLTANFNTPWASGSNELISAGSSDIFVIKYNTSGGLLWRQRGGGTQNDFGEAIVRRGITNVFVTGYYNGTINFNTPSAVGTNEIQPIGLFDLFVAEYSSAGVLLGLQRGGGQSDDVGTSVAIGAFGALHVVGRFESLAQYGLTSLVNTLSGYGSGFITFMKQ